MAKDVHIGLISLLDFMDHASTLMSAWICIEDAEGLPAGELVHPGVGPGLLKALGPLRPGHPPLPHCTPLQQMAESCITGFDKQATPISACIQPT